MYVDITAKQDNFNKQLSGLKGQLTGMGTAIGVAVGNIASNVITSATSAVGSFISRGIAGAANLGESMSKVEQVFGDSAGTITGVAEDLAKKFGLPKQAILDAGASIGLVGKAAGQSQQQAADMGASMAKLAADASSFYNVPLDTALEKIRSGLVGESEPMRAFGVLLSEEAVAAEAVAMGLAKSTKEVDQQDKVMARASLITKGLKDATGDLERTQDSTSNQYRKFQGTLENTAVTLGTALAPAVQAVIQGVTGLATNVASFVTGSQASITAWAQSFANALQSLPGYWDLIVTSMAAGMLKAEEFGTNVGAVISATIANFGLFGDYIGNNWQKLIADALNAVGAIFTNFGANIKDGWTAVMEFIQTGEWHFNWTPLLTDFKATADKLPDIIKPQFVSMDGAITELAAGLAGRTLERQRQAALGAGGVSGAAGAVAADVAKAAGKKEKDFKVESMGIGDVYTNLRQSIFSDKDDKPAQTLKLTERVAKATEAIADNTKQKPVAVLAP